MPSAIGMRPRASWGECSSISNRSWCAYARPARLRATSSVIAVSGRRRGDRTDDARLADRQVEHGRGERERDVGVPHPVVRPGHLKRIAAEERAEEATDLV